MTRYSMYSGERIRDFTASRDVDHNNRLLDAGINPGLVNGHCVFPDEGRVAASNGNGVVVQNGRNGGRRHYNSLVRPKRRDQVLLSNGEK